MTKGDVIIPTVKSKIDATRGRVEENNLFHPIDLPIGAISFIREAYHLV